ncbi:hypothetical protein GCM10017708_31510 [Arthrobacter citreus]
MVMVARPRPEAMRAVGEEVLEVMRSSLPTGARRGLRAGGLRGRGPVIGRVEA